MGIASGLLSGRFSDKAVVCEEMDPREAVPELLPGPELEQVADAAAKRQHDFAVGRTLARRALRRIGVENVVLRSDSDRVPLWPDGIVGSITHTSNWAAVAVAHRRTLRSIGLDLEGDAPLKEALVPYVCSASDSDWLARQPTSDRLRLAKLVFSAKEAAYKAQYPITRVGLGFHDLELDIDLDGGFFRALFRRDAGTAFARGHALEGVFRFEAGLVASAVFVPT